MLSAEREGVGPNSDRIQPVLQSHPSRLRPPFLLYRTAFADYTRTVSVIKCEMFAVVQTTDLYSLDFLRPITTTVF